MIAILNPPTITPDDLLQMPDASNFELVDGHLVERNMSTLSCLVEGLTFKRFKPMRGQTDSAPSGPEPWVSPVFQIGRGIFVDRPSRS